MSLTPKISIITVVYNAAALIEKTIQSVKTQTCPFIEYIIIDGASTDSTLSIINNYKEYITILVSEKDNGIYDAMNKGLQKATGEYVLFLNAGDELAHINTLQKVFDISVDADVYYGNTAVINKENKIIGNRRLSPPLHINWKSLRFGMCVSHQSFIAKRTLCKPYNTTYKISADIDWVINVLKNASSIVNTHLTISKFLEGGTSNKQRKRALLERFNIMVIHYGFFATVINHIYILLRFPFHWLSRKSMT